MPDEIDEKSGDIVAEVLASKHPEARTPNASSLNKHTNAPNFLDVDFTEKLSRRLLGISLVAPASLELTAMLFSIGCSDLELPVTNSAPLQQRLLTGYRIPSPLGQHFEL